MVSQRQVSDNIIKLRELTNKICNSVDVDYFDIVNEIKNIISTSSRTIDFEKNKDKKIRIYELMVERIQSIVNQK